MPARRLLPGPLRRGLRASVGLWPLLEARNRLRYAPEVLRLRRVEAREVRRLRRVLGVPPRARVVTIVPTFRRPGSLAAAVASALAQTVADHHVVVVDDGGGLPGLPADPRLTAVALSRNTAVLGLVRNVGIRLSRSDFVAFLDDDNTWRPDHLALALSAMRDGAEVTYAAVERRLADGTVMDVLSVPYSRRRLRQDASCVDANSLVVRRRRGVVFSRIPRVRTTLPKEDWEFFRRVTRGRRVHHVPEPTVRYLVNLDSHYTSWRLPADGSPSGCAQPDGDPAG